MSKCLNLTKAGEYAIAAMSRLAHEAEGRPARPVAITRLAEAQGIPASFLSKIMGQCAKAGLVSTKKGADGGVCLSRPAHEITILAIVEACEGSYSREDCVFFGEKHCDGEACEVYCPLREEEDALRKSLGRVTLADMAESLGRHPFLNPEKGDGRFTWR